jgi:Trypsin-co-occurring domain 2
MPDLDEIRLADAVEAVRNELILAMERAHDQRVTFQVGAVEMEFTVALTRDAGLNGGINVGVVTIGGKGGLSQQETQKVKVTLTPVDTETGEHPVVNSSMSAIPPE